MRSMTLLVGLGAIAFAIVACAEGVPTPPLTTDSGGSGGSAGGSQGGSQGGNGPENCLDGIDNDGNDKIDCADPACQPGHECVPSVPAGWRALRMAAASFPIPDSEACPSGEAPVSYFAVPGEAASCTICSCGSLQGGSCSLPQMSCYHDNGCSGQADFTSALDTSCHDLPAAILCASTCNLPRRCELSSPAAVAGNPSCPVSGGTADVPAAWAWQLDTCSLPSVGAGCEDEQACIPVGEAPYNLPACIQIDDDMDCPAGWPDPVVAFADAQDSRGCSACSCTAAASCNGGHVTVYDNDNCQDGGDGPVDVASNCQLVTNQFDYLSASYHAVAATVSGDCQPQGGQPTGAVEPIGAVKLCCLQLP